ncbi:amidohydrolase, partial [Sphingomonas bacterium]|uniref:amidohydrolase n=1 Tax=Sphingomonas bacterium TaxID=1895847 RepID=UPI001577770E
MLSASLRRLAAGFLLLLPVAAGAAKRQPIAVAAPVSAGALVDNVTGLTLDTDGRVVRFTGLLMTADGHVVRLLAAGEKRPERLDWRADMKGRVLLPGFVDGEGHVMDLGFRALELDLSAATSLADAQARIAAYAAANADRNWVIGAGWNQEQLGRAPTAADLAGIAPDRPIVLDRADGHAVWLNEAAMKAMGITAATPAPASGRILRGPGNAPTGVFVDAARDMVLRMVPQPRAADRDNAFLKAQAMLLANGVTAVADLSTRLPDWLTFRRIADQGGLRLRIASYADSIETANLTAGKGPSPWLYGDRLKLIGVAMVADGSLGARGACLKAAYADAPRESGQCIAGDRLRNLMSRAAMDGFQVAVDATGDRANDEVLGAVEELSETYTGDRRWRIEHAQIVTAGDLPRFGRHGIIASMQPADVASDVQDSGLQVYLEIDRDAAGQ